MLKKDEKIKGETYPNTTMALRAFDANTGERLSWNSFGDTISDAEGKYEINVGKIFARAGKNKYGNDIKFANQDDLSTFELKDGIDSQNGLAKYINEDGTLKDEVDGKKIKYQVEAWSDGFDGRPLFSEPEITSKPIENVKNYSEAVEKLNVSSPTLVNNKNALSEDEKAAVKQAIKTANPNVKDVEVDNQGNVTSVTLDNGQTLDANSDALAKFKQVDTVYGVGMLSNTIVVNYVPVEDINALTETEKKSVVDAFKKANPKLNIEDVTVDDKGNITAIKFMSGVTINEKQKPELFAKLKQANTVKAAGGQGGGQDHIFNNADIETGANPNANSANNSLIASNTSGNGAQYPETRSEMRQRLAKTGANATNAGLLGGLFAALGGLMVAGRRRRGGSDK